MFWWWNFTFFALIGFTWLEFFYYQKRLQIGLRPKKVLRGSFGKSNEYVPLWGLSIVKNKNIVPCIVDQPYIQMLFRQFSNLGRSSEKKICFCLEFLQCPNPNILRNFLVLFMFGIFLWTFLLEFRHFLGRGGGVAWFQRWWGTFVCCGLDIFQGKWGRMTKIQTFWGTLVRLK